MGKNAQAYALTDTLDHLQDVVLSKVGAGLPLRKSYHHDRWVKAYADSAIADPQAFHQNVYKAMAVAVFDDDPTAVRLAASKAVIAYVRAMAPTWISGDDRGGQHMVYKLYNEFRALLYVGITDRGPTRLVEHYRHKPWFYQVVRVEFERFDSREKSGAREIQLITSLRPLYNIQHNGRK